MAKVCTNFCGFLHRVCFAVAVCFVSLFCVNGAWAATFELTTTELAAGDTFQFMISAQGTFEVDCGDGGTLSGTGVTPGTTTIDHTSNTTNYTYTCTYDTDGAKVIVFDGTADAYNTGATTSAISFYTSAANAANVSEISGDLSAIFPVLGSNDYEKPIFYQTFRGCTRLETIPSELFTHITSVKSSMFRETFYDCTGLSEIPDGLFGNLTGSPATSMFYQTFYNCSGLTGSIPDGLFGNLSGSPAQSMFYATFYNCSGLSGEIPDGLFGNISGSPANYMFYRTFYNCSGLTGSIPDGLFGNLTGSPATSMFYQTFFGCSGLTGSIPDGLFGNLSGSPAQSMFYATFYNCRGLSGEIPDGLFGNIYGAPAMMMFMSTFYGCSGLTGFGGKTYVPGDFLANINTNTSVSSQATNMFYGTQLNDPCPANTYASTRQQFNNADKPWCTECPSGTTSPAGSTSASQCVVTYNITYYDSDCSTVLTGLTPTTYTANDTVVLATPTRTGYTFNNGWCGSCGSNCGLTGWQASARTGNQSIYMNPNAWVPNIYTITLQNYNNSGTHGMIYEKYATGWYSDSAATTSINAATVPTRSGYTFRGFYTTTQSDLSASGGSGTRAINASGTLPANNAYTANTPLYAAWARSCNPGAGCTCNLVVNDDGTVTYQTGADTGYTLTSGSGTYAPVCTGNSVSLTWDGGGSPSACTYGGTFVPPTPAARTGYVFTGWHIRQCDLSGLDAGTSGEWGASRSLAGHCFYYDHDTGDEIYDCADSHFEGLDNDGEWRTDFDYGTIKGTSYCSGKIGNEHGYQWNGNSSDWRATESELTSASGEKEYCWCSVISYTLDGETECNIASSSWVFSSERASNCRDWCAESCAYSAKTEYGYGVNFRQALFGISQ